MGRGEEKRRQGYSGRDEGQLDFHEKREACIRKRYDAYEIGRARELLRYLENNEGGLLPYDQQGSGIPEPPEGILYKHMGVQENRSCTVITMWMKHRRMRCSTRGASNLVKALYRRENRELIETIDRYTDGLVCTVQMEQVPEVLSAAKASKKEGKGKSLCRLDKRSYAASGRHADDIQESVQEGIPWIGDS